MTAAERKELTDDIKQAVNNAMQMTHKKWDKRVPSEELRLWICRILTDRAFEAGLEAVEKGCRPARKLDAMISLLKQGVAPQQAATLTEEAIK